MLFEFIQKIHQRPLHERRRIAFWLAFFITLFIVGIWLLTLLIRSANKPTIAPTEEPVSPFEGVADSLQDGFDSFKNFFPKGDTE